MRRHGAQRLYRLASKQLDPFRKGAGASHIAAALEDIETRDPDPDVLSEVVAASFVTILLRECLVDE